MQMSSLLWLAVALVALFLYLLIWFNRGRGAIAKGLRATRAIDAVMEAYRAGDYAAALLAAEGLKNGFLKTPAYFFLRGEMLHHMGRLDEAEASLREGLPLEDDPRQKALVYNTIATVLMDQERFTEAITFYENAGLAWPDRGSSHRGIAEVWLRGGRELSKALQEARQAVEIDRHAGGMKKEALDQRLGEDLAVLAWAIAANSGEAGEVESLLVEAFQLCGSRTKPVSAQIHYHAARAYAALQRSDKSGEHFRKAAELDPQGIFGRMARSTGS